MTTEVVAAVALLLLPEAVFFVLLPLLSVTTAVDAVIVALAEAVGGLAKFRIAK